MLHAAVSRITTDTWVFTEKQLVKKMFVSFLFFFIRNMFEQWKKALFQACIDKGQDEVQRPKIYTQVKMSLWPPWRHIYTL